ncbi:MAG: hypothetical protein OXU61_07235, partial [Gammaproteobacteria bacterium]|nr:hypothetical protein [Gammaproteobacteria bacterium]
MPPSSRPRVPGAYIWRLETESRAIKPFQRSRSAVAALTGAGAETSCAPWDRIAGAACAGLAVAASRKPLPNRRQAKRLSLYLPWFPAFVRITPPLRGSRQDEGASPKS